MRPYIFMCIYSRSHQTHERFVRGEVHRKNVQQPSFPHSAFQLARGEAAFPDASGFFVGPTRFGNPKTLGNQGVEKRVRGNYPHPRRRVGTLLFPALVLPQAAKAKPKVRCFLSSRRNRTQALAIKVGYFGYPAPHHPRGWRASPRDGIVSKTWNIRPP